MVWPKNLGASAFNLIVNFEAFFMKIGIYVHFGHTKKYAQIFLENYPKWPKFENGLKLEYVRKNPIFD